MPDIADATQRELEAMDQRIKVAAESSRVVHDMDFERRRAITHCATCGEQISAQRKSAMAHAIRCAECETERENRGKK